MKCSRQSRGIGSGGHSASGGATLVELLASMAILSVLLVVLGVTLETAMGRFRSGAELTGNHSSAQIAATRIEKDLASHLSSRPARLPRLPEGTTPVQRRFFEDRIFLPFEINRSAGTGMNEPRSFQNAAPEFDSLAFATALPSQSPGNGEPLPGLVGYYVAYSRNSPLAGDETAGMKLIRHFRRGGPHFGDGYAGGLLLACSRDINGTGSRANPESPLAPVSPNSPAIRRGSFHNADLPFLFSRRLTGLDSPAPVPATQPWPTYPVEERLLSPPPTFHPERGTPEAWENAGSPVHDAVFPDEPICDHVVRFEIKPFRRVALDGGGTEIMDAVALNLHLGLEGGAEWPVLVTPDFIEVFIATLSKKAALTLTRYEDWLVDWDDSNRLSWSARRQFIERETQTFRFRVPLPRRSR